MTFVMPQSSSESLNVQILRGAEGIEEVKQSLCQVDVKEAEAWDPRDKLQVGDVKRLCCCVLQILSIFDGF